MTERHATVQLPSGVRLHYVESGGAPGSETGGATGREPILFVHGWPDSCVSFSQVMPRLPPDRRALAVDLRGFGDSDRPPDGYAITDLADDIVALLDALGIARVVLVGHSFGSFVARQVAIGSPDGVAALVLIGTGFSTVNEVTRGLQQSLRELPDPIPVTFAREFQSSTIHHPIPPAFFDRLLNESLKLPPRLWRVLIDRMIDYDGTAELSRISAPTLLLWGRQDAIFSREDQERFLVASPGSQLKVYEDTGHCPNWERPGLVAADIAGFVDRR
jgi:non-heme chloroperoxidase